MTYAVHNEDFLAGVHRIPNASVDLVIADPPYGLGKDYGNESDMMSPDEFLEWTRAWVDLTLPKIKDTGSMYIFTTWRRSPEIFAFIKTRMLMVNEIIWDRKVPSMGGTTRRFSSVHDTIGFFAKSKCYYFDLDAVRIPYDPETKRRAPAPYSWARNGWKSDTTQRTCGAFRGCTGCTKSAKIILRKSRWR